MTDFNIRHIDQSALKIVQINLQRARAATAQVIQYAMETETDFILAQEPYLYDNRVSDFPLSWTVFQGNTAEGPRTAIICCQQKWSPTIVLASRDVITIAVETLNINVLITDVYLSPSEDMTHSLELIQRTLVQYPSASHLLAGDFNAHSKVWNYPSTDARGRTIEDFVASNDLTLHNTEDSPPTYETVHGRGWPDLTLTSASLAPFIQQWTVQDLPSNSDHLYITYNICHPHTRMTLKRYKLTKRKTAQFINKVRFSLRSAEEDLTACTTSQDLESFTSSLISTIQDICNSTFSLKTRKNAAYAELVDERSPSAAQ
ncbi:uncharacterized protein LOC118206014 [Stegodyphus dumicola]|uniref:uncharacterized protein LOC118206014 n=1 Tax=Stegodyphus dumicola TaxID=202533 RepID=UPI0015ABF0D1|nr:uncharacterized protein LOC118206014 [Stegodyphus dumicola]